ncbi:hypothetical protein B0H16DRAFT_1903006 [Mycena metata]|uniref:Uncharacterized protein n=1 Tax=Mycena metata TaxID=1033252 RepID=A0AAD7DUT3_9AGAR|nr:hypothetical protein B0H16DRAFT_1903006 [Mycena metata]
MTSSFEMPTSSTTITSTTSSSGTLGKRTRLEFDDGADAGRSPKRVKPTVACLARVPHSSFRHQYRHRQASLRKFTGVDVLPSSFAELYQACAMELLVHSFDGVGMQPAGDDAREMDSLVQGLDGLGLQPTGAAAIEMDALCLGITTVDLEDESGDIIMTDTLQTANPTPTPYSSTIAIISTLQDRTNKASAGSKSKGKKIPGGVKRTTSSAKENAPYPVSGRKSSMLPLFICSITISPSSADPRYGSCAPEARICCLLGCLIYRRGTWHDASRSRFLFFISASLFLLETRPTLSRGHSYPRIWICCLFQKNPILRLLLDPVLPTFPRWLSHAADTCLDLDALPHSPLMVGDLATTVMTPGDIAPLGSRYSVFSAAKPTPRLRRARRHCLYRSFTLRSLSAPAALPGADCLYPDLILLRASPDVLYSRTPPQVPARHPHPPSVTRRHPCGPDFLLAHNDLHEPIVSSRLRVSVLSRPHYTHTVYPHVSLARHLCLPQDPSTHSVLSWCSPLWSLFSCLVLVVSSCLSWPLPSLAPALNTVPPLVDYCIPQTPAFRSQDPPTASVLRLLPPQIASTLQLSRKPPSSRLVSSDLVPLPCFGPVCDYQPEGPILHPPAPATVTIDPPANPPPPLCQILDRVNVTDFSTGNISRQILTSVPSAENTQHHPSS